MVDLVWVNLRVGRYTFGDLCLSTGAQFEILARLGLAGGVSVGAKKEEKKKEDPLLGAGVVKGSMVPTRSDPRLARAPPPSRKGITNFNNAKISKKSKSLLS